MVPVDFKVGDRVQFTNLLPRGRTGTISRPARVLWKPAWMVELDGGSWVMGRTRAIEKVLRHMT